MGKIIRVGGIDPSLTGCGIATLDLDLSTMGLTLVRLVLKGTSPEPTKKIRPASDKLRRATEVAEVLRSESHDWTVVFSEVPSGAKDYNAAVTFGMVTGWLAYLSLGVPLIEVQPSETKLVATGSKNGAKEEEFEWAKQNFPDASWVRRKAAKGKDLGPILGIAMNGNLSDAIAVAHAGVRTPEFRRSTALWLKAA